MEAKSEYIVRQVFLLVYDPRLIRKKMDRIFFSERMKIRFFNLMLTFKIL